MGIYMTYMGIYVTGAGSVFYMTFTWPETSQIYMGIYMTYMAFYMGIYVI
jgi:hypothetical protein